MKKAPFKAYKATDSNLQCRGEQFEIGKTYVKNSPFLKIGTDTGWHYCEKLINTFQFYRNNNQNRYFEIEVLGNYVSDSLKSITDCFKIIRELTPNEIETITKKEKEMQNIEQITNSATFVTLKEILKEHKDVIVAGSIGLFLQGFNVNVVNDIDLVYHKYINLGRKVKLSGDYPNKDFDYAFEKNFVKIDLKINPYQTYKTVYIQGIGDINVVDYFEILSHKFAYAAKGNQKQMQKLDDLLKARFKFPEDIENADLPF